MNKDTMRMCVKAKKKRILTPVQVEETFWLSRMLTIHSNNNHQVGSILKKADFIYFISRCHLVGVQADNDVQAYL